MVYEEAEEVIHNIKLPEHWVYDSETGEMVNMRSGVVTNRRCYVAASGVVNEYSIDPDNLICGETTQNGDICISKYTHPQSKRETNRAHRSREGITWIDESQS